MARTWIQLVFMRGIIFLSFLGSSSSDTCTLRMCNIYDTETGIWTRGPNMNEERSYHGLVRISDILYAVGGCGQLNSMESLYLSSMDRYVIDNQLVQKIIIGKRDSKFQ